MEVIRDPATVGMLVRGYHAEGQKVGLVPTMGALHSGHLSLVRLARAKSERVVASIFVNPTQFGPNEDYLRYPRSEDRDLEMLEGAGADAAYLPTVAAMYRPDATVSVDPGPVGRMFEGKFRPGHFAGVLTVVAKLFHQVQPDLAVFGQKDAQQLFLVRRMVRDLDFATEIIEGTTVRETDGLAISSRNVYLKAAERKAATILYQALKTAQTAMESEVRSLAQLQEAMRNAVAMQENVGVDYLTVVSEDTFHEEDPVPNALRVIGAIRLGSVRLIDNIPVSIS